MPKISCVSAELPTLNRGSLESPLASINSKRPSCQSSVNEASNRTEKLGPDSLPTACSGVQAETEIQMQVIKIEAGHRRNIAVLGSQEKG